jgi:hypothetical protein
MRARSVLIEGCLIHPPIIMFSSLYLLVILLIVCWSSIHGFTSIRPNIFRSKHFKLNDVKVGIVEKEDSTGICAGGHEDGGFYSFGAKKNVPGIHESANVRVPDMRTVEKGYSDARTRRTKDLMKLKTGPFSKAEVKDYLWLPLLTMKLPN